MRGGGSSICTVSVPLSCRENRQPEACKFEHSNSRSFIIISFPFRPRLSSVSFTKNIHFPHCIRSPHKIVDLRTLKSCQDHIGHPLLKPCGHVMKDKAVTNELRNLRQELSAKHQPKGNGQLTPSQVRAIRRELLKPCHKGAVASISGQQLYLMMLLGIKTFGRADDTCVIKLADFPREHGNVSRSPFLVKYVSVFVRGKGKEDDEYTLLRLFRDDICPEFCPVRHLLAYLHVTGIEGNDDGSYLFPKIKDLEEHVAARQLNPKLKKRFNTPVPYLNLKDRMKVSCELHWALGAKSY